MRMILQDVRRQIAVLRAVSEARRVNQAVVATEWIKKLHGQGDADLPSILRVGISGEAAVEEVSAVRADVLDLQAIQAQAPFLLKLLIEVHVCLVARARFYLPNVAACRLVRDPSDVGLGLLG